MNTIGDYSLSKKLGQGRFAKVWSIEGGSDSPIIAKIYSTRHEDLKYYKNEIMCLTRVANACAIYDAENNREDSESYILQLLECKIDIKIDDESDRVRLIPFLIFEEAKMTVKSYLKKRANGDVGGVSITKAKEMMIRLLHGLEIMHASGLIHADINPSNLLIDRNDNLIISDVGSSMEVSDVHCSVGTPGYRAPELLICRPKYVSTAIDIWAAYCTFYEFITGDYLFDIYNDCRIRYNKYHQDKHSESSYDSGISDSEISPSDSHSDNTSCTSDSSSDSESYEEDIHDSDELTMKLIDRILGPPPASFVKYSDAFYNKRGALKKKPNMVYTSIRELLRRNYILDNKESYEEVAEFMKPGLRFISSQRITAVESLANAWLTKISNV